MAFIKRKSTHLCMPPVMIVDPEDGIAVVDGSIGDLWRCDECARLWQCRFTAAFPGRIWWRPSWWALIWFRRTKPKLIYQSGLDILDRTKVNFSTGLAPCDPWSEDVLVSHS